MLNKDKIAAATHASPAFVELIVHCINVKYLIYANGGMANKSAVEDVVMATYAVTREAAHEALNLIEYHCLDNDIYRRSGREPAVTLADYPEILTTKIRWYRGVPTL